MEKIILLLVATSLFCSNVYADKPNNGYIYNLNVTDAVPNNVAISYCDCSLIMTDGTASCYGMTKAYNDYKAKVKIELQQYDSKWRTIDNWTKTSNTSSASLYESTPVSKGYSYRVKTTHTALDTNGNVVETITNYSSTKKY